MSKTSHFMALEFSGQNLPELNRDVAAFGLNPRVYIGVLENCELTQFGLVNANGRIYPEELGQAAIEMFNQRCQLQTVDGDDGHPDENKLKLSRFAGCAVVWLSAETYRTADGILAARGKLALLDTTYGRDLAVIYEAGIKLGVSSRALATFQETWLDDSSVWMARPENQRFRNRWVEVCTAWDLGPRGTFDIVRKPSAGTFIESTNPHVREAYESLVQANLIHEETVMPKSNPPATEVPATAVESGVTPVAPVPEAPAVPASVPAVAVVAEPPAAESDTITMTRAEYQKLTADLQRNAAQSATTESAQLKVTLTAQESALATLTAQVKALTEANEAQKASIKAAETRSALDQFITECAPKPNGAYIVKSLQLLRDKGVITTATEAQVQAEVFTSAHEAVGTPATTTTPAPSVRADEAANTPKPNDPVLAYLSGSL